MDQYLGINNMAFLVYPDTIPNNNLTACNTPIVPWDEQQGYNPYEDGHVKCDNCKVPLKQHEADWARVR